MNIAGCRVLVVGGGAVALRRVRTLLTCGAFVTVVSPEFHKDFEELSLTHKNNLRLIERRYEARDFGDIDIVMALPATNPRQLNRGSGEGARKAGIPVSVADAPEECTFFFPSLTAEGEVAVAISAGGRPSLNRCLSERLRAVWRDWVKQAEQEVKICEKTCENNHSRR